MPRSRITEGASVPVGVRPTERAHPLRVRAVLTRCVTHSYVAAMELKGQMRVTSWQEDEIRPLEATGSKVTRASIGYQLIGDVDGEAVSDVVMCYRPDGTAVVVGLWTLTGSAAGQAGSVAFEAIGGYDGTTATAPLRLLSGLSSGGFAAARGHGTTSATREKVEYVLHLEL